MNKADLNAIKLKLILSNLVNTYHEIKAIKKACLSKDLAEELLTLLSILGEEVKRIVARPKIKRKKIC